MTLKKEKVIDFAVLSLRWYLIFYMASYGYSKLTLSQFGVYDDAIIQQPIKDIDSFYVAWHLFTRSTFFNVITGALEIIAAILLIFNRTALIGALLTLSILAQILIIDISFTTGIHGFSLPLRIGGMILADLLILYYYKEHVINALKSLTKNVSTKFKYKWWVFILLPIIGLFMDFVFSIFTLPIKILLSYFSK